MILGQLAKIEALSFLGFIAETLSASSPLVGACIGMAIAYGMKCPLLVNVSSAIVGALGYRFGGPVGAYLAVASGCRAGLARIEAHSGRYNRHAAGHDRRRRYVRQVVLLAEINDMMLRLGMLINHATTLNPFFMGIAVAVLVGCALTLPISSVAICVMLNLDGLAAGAATAGCCAQMIGFAVISFRDNGISGLISQGASERRCCR